MSSHRVAPALLSFFVASALVVGCTTRAPGREDAGTGVGFDAGSPTPRSDGGVRDPFASDGACGTAAIPTERVPGSLLLVFDRSSSMSEDVNGNREGDRGFMAPTKWDASEQAISAALGTASDELGVGLLLFPTLVGDVCDVSIGPGVPQLPMAPLATNRSLITNTLASGPMGGNTPIHAAMHAGYQYLDSLTTSGQRGLVLVTDGAENCDRSGDAAILDEVQRRHDVDGYLTFAVGLTSDDNFLSSVALNGGTPRDTTCMAECVPPITRCSSPADCGAGARCVVGFCVSSGTPDCCSYTAGTASFTTDFQAAIDAIARRFLESCVFRLPRGADPSMFDPNRVNVGVTFDGEPRTVLGRRADTTMDGWDYTSDTQDAIVIEGPICDRLLHAPAQVEIVLGCPSIVF